MANNYLQFSEVLTLKNPKEAEWVKRRLGLFKRVGESDDPESHPEYSDYEKMVKQYVNHGDDPVIEFDWNIEQRRADGRFLLYIFSEESGNIDQAAIFVQEFLLNFTPDKCFYISWAETCSRPRAGEFGGGAAFITAKKIQWMNIADWCDDKRKKFEK